jgi:excisionase family DNA binding protein
LSAPQLEEETTKRVYIIEALVGSKEWVYAIQESILDHRSICFGCAQPINFKTDFFYMTGSRGIVMLHYHCFGLAEKRPIEFRRVELSGGRKLPVGEWLTIAEVCKYVGVGYMAIYQRIVSGKLPAEKRDGKWMIPRRAVETMGPGRLLPGPKVGKIYPNKRVWRSEVTEPIERLSPTQAAKKIGVSRTWVLERKDKFDAIKVGGEWRLSAKMVDAYIENEERNGI